MMQIVKALFITGAVVFALPSCSAGASDTITVPWNQFKDLYRDQVKKQLMLELKPAGKKALPTELSSNLCKVVFSKQTCTISYSIKGRRGDVKQELLLKGNPAVTTPSSTGCARLQRVKGGIGIALAPEGPPDFTVSFSVILEVTEDRGIYKTVLELPDALTNEVQVELKDQLQLLKLPWGNTNGKTNMFAGAPGRVIIAATDSSIAKIKLPPDVDLFTIYRFRANRLQLQINVSANPGSCRDFILHLPQGTRYSRGTLPRFAQPDNSDGISISMPEKINSFNLNCELEFTNKQKLEKLIQPYINENRGREGFFNIEQPPGAEVKVTGNGLQNDVFSADGKNKALNCQSAPSGTPLSFTIRRLAIVSQPEVIVETIYFCSALEENGSIISVLSFDYPGSGKLKLKKIGDGELWRFAVNGKKSGIYEDGDYWQVELPTGNNSNKVEMAFLHHGEKPGIQGIYRSAMPNCGINARRVIYSAVLPKRLELQSFEGGIDPLPENISPPRLPENINGNRYNFYRPYYRGGKIAAEFFYREPPKK